MDQIDYQVGDDFSLLESMMADIQVADPIYQPTNYWDTYEKKFLPELKRKGLKDFRRRRRSVLGSFGATDLSIYAGIKISSRHDFMQKLGDWLTSMLEKSKFISIAPYGIKPEFVVFYFYEYVKQKMDQVGLSLDKCPTSLYGNPENIVDINSGFWSLRHLQNCVLLADALRYITIKDGDVIFELGTGMGRNIEAMAHLYPHSTFFVMDIPPQLYIANQYLQSVFGKRVLAYRDAISISPEKDGSLLDVVKGKIIILPTWRMPAWSNTKINLFWNSASFQEMEPDVVKNYLQIVCNMAPDMIYINALPQGNYWGTWKPGMGGTKLPVTEDVYFDSLNGFYETQQKYNTDYFMRKKDYKSYIFRRLK